MDKKKNLRHNGKRFFKFLPGIIAVFALFTAVVMWLWNALLPEILNLPEINFWQALGLMILTRLLFGGLKTYRFKPHHHGHKHGHFRKKWMNLTPEERKAFIMKRYFSECDNEMTENTTTGAE